MSRPNVFSIQGATFGQGIKVAHSSAERPELHIGSGASSRLVWFGNGDHKTWPEIRNEMLVRADIVYVERKARAVFAPESWQGILVKVAVRDLDFGLKPFAEGLNLHPGGMGFPASVDNGNCDLEVREQLFRLESGHRMLVADRQCGVMLLACVSGQPYLRPATLEELGKHVQVTGFRSEMLRGTEWAIRTLARLGFATPSDLQARHDYLEGLARS